MKLINMHCEHCGRKIKDKAVKKKIINIQLAKPVEPRTILSQYRQLLQHHPEMINGLLLH